MGLPWKKVGRFLLGLGKSGLVPVPGLPAVIEGIEDALPHDSGQTKLETVSKIADALLDETVVLADLTTEQRQQLDTLKINYINTYVATRNLEAQFEENARQLQAFIDSVKKKG